MGQIEVRESGEKGKGIYACNYFKKRDSILTFLGSKILTERGIHTL